MSDLYSESEDTPKHSMVQSLPSDYSDVQSKSYDPDYISDISNRMQVPDTLQAVDGVESQAHQYIERQQMGDMIVPERIFVGGEGQHVGAKGRLRQLDFDRVPQSEMSYVGLITPPRTLTLEESFPMVEQEEVIEKRPQPVHVANGHLPVPYTPGISPNDSLLLNEEDEASLMRTQVAKLTRRIAVMEQDNHRRGNRELILYPVIFSYFMMKIFWWLFKTK